MKNTRITLFHISILLVPLALGVSCKDDIQDPGPEVAAPIDVKITDRANFGDGRDIGLSFAKPESLEGIEIFQVFVVRAEEKDNFDLAQALEVSGSMSLTVNSETSNLFLRPNEKDINGNPISEGVDYVLFVLSKATEEAGVPGVLSEKSNAISLRLNNVVRTLTGEMNEGSGGMEVDGEGMIYMGDFGFSLSQANGTNVVKITPEGRVSTFATGLIGASGNDFDDEGNLYQSNIADNSVSKITPDGTATIFARGFKSPVGIVYDGKEFFYVCNCNSNTLSKMDKLGNVALFASGSRFNCPNGIDIDKEGNLYVANFGNNTIVKIDPEGMTSSFATTPGSNNGHLLIKQEYIYVVSRGLNQIHRVSLATGSVQLFAGNGKRGVVDGPLMEAGFSLPNDIAFSPDGKYAYVNDVISRNPDQAVISPTVIRVIEMVE